MEGFQIPRSYHEGMSKFSLGSSLLVAALLLTGCTAEGDVAEPSPEPTPTIDQKLVPTEPPADVVDVDPAAFLTSYGDVIFKVGDGPTWCTMSEFDDFVTCEHKEFDAKYELLPVPEDCQYTYGYQLRLYGSPVEGSKMAEFTCANANWSDASSSPALASGQRITTYGFSCFVEGQVARCENGSGDFIVLGPEAWATSD
jgi:hypothetical protein